MKHSPNASPLSVSSAILVLAQKTGSRDAELSVDSKIKHAKGRLRLNESIESWFRRAVQRHDIAELPLDFRSAIRASQLPVIHGGPADRLLIAAAIEHNLTLISPDPFIRKYPGLQTLW